MRRVLAVGLDSVDEADLERRIAAGTMPNLAALRERGTWCSLALDARCRSEHPWTAFVTGQEPVTVGRWTAVTFDPATYHYGYEGAVTTEPFWAVGDQADVVVLDVPAATLATDLRGVQVVDWATHDPMHERCSLPSGLLGEVLDRFGESPASALEYAGAWNDAAWLHEYGRALVDSVRLRTRVIEDLFTATPDWRLAVVVFGETHQLAHQAWHGVATESVLSGTPTADAGRRAEDDVHRALDVAVGRLAARLGPDDALVVFSPKGIEAISDVSTNVLAPELAHRLAFGSARLQQPSPRRWQRRGRPPVVLPGGMSHVPEMRASFGGSRWDRIRQTARRGTFRAAAAAVPDVMARRRVARRRARNVRPAWSTPETATVGPLTGDLLFDGWIVSTWYRPWWPRMRWFVVPAFADLHVRVNVVGREAEGIVPVEGYEAVCAEVEAVFRACRNPRTGNRLVADVARPRGGDPFAEAGLPADVIVSWAEDTDALEHPDVGLVGPYPAWRCSGHGARAFALTAGAGIGSGHLTGPRLVDLPATLLALAGLDPASPLDGTPFLEGSPVARDRR